MIMRVMMAMCLIGGAPAAVAQPQALSAEWTVAVNGQVAPVGGDGTFVVPNITAPDLFGPSGPGSGPDFVSDDYVRVIASRVGPNGVAEWAFSDGFLFASGVPVEIDTEDLTFTTVPPPFPESLSLDSVTGSGVLTSIGDMVQLVTLAALRVGVNRT